MAAGCGYRASQEVLHWPADAGRLAQCWADKGLVVIAVETPSTTIRDAARAGIRTALREALGLLLGRAAEDVPLVSSPGSPVRLELPGSGIMLSVSHEPGLSIAAIARGHCVGIDLMRVDDAMEWETVAADYLGPQARSRIANAQDFTREWTRLEAALKCRGMPLAEWHPDVETLLGQSTLIDLSLPRGFAGTVALIANS